MTSVGARLNEERNRLDMSMTSFAAIGGVQLNAQRQYERDERYPRANYFEAIASAGADVLYVLIGVRSAMDSDGLTNEERLMMTSYRCLRVDSQGVFRHLLGSLTRKPVAVPGC